MKCIILFALYFFVSGLNIAQTPDLSIIPSGIEFSDGSHQTSALTSNDNGSNYHWNVYIEYSNGIVGDVTVTGYENHSLALLINHELYRELNANGLPGTTQHHKAMLIKKDIDKANTDLYNAFNNNLVIDQIVMKFVRPLGNGSTAEKYRVTLANVKISEIKSELGFVQETGFFKGIQSLRLVYQSMTVQHFSPNDTVTLNYQY